ncbi:MAG: histidine--tRNA ligase [Candidatus Dormibacteraeota bacterium]|nr:histidine--tRNA ligase [Candidatus Dormibacteraeota bacterium]
MPEIASPRGTRDILPADQAAYRWVLDTHSRVAELHAYRPVETPIIEATELFARAVGSDTDIVEKQMFTFDDRGGRSLTLRPEGTAGVTRAALAARLDQELRPLRLHYAGPMFRAERPQAGRQHQFTQLGIECIGERSASVDAEVVEIAWRFFAALGLHGVQLQVNSLGSPEDRARYREALVAYYEPLRDRLCDDCQRRLDTNPLRLLDCKRDAQFAESAPKIAASLSRESTEFFGRVLEILDTAAIPVTLNPRLVRGLDYYTDTVFEIWHETLSGAQNALGGGGRYDGLAALLGFAATPGCGYALGVERTIMVAKELGVAPGAAAGVDVLVASVDPPQAAAAARQARTLRDAGIRTMLDAGERRLDRKLRSADKAGARLAVVVGEDEVRDGNVTVRDLSQHSQQRVPEAELAALTLRILGMQQ